MEQNPESKVYIDLRRKILEGNLKDGDRLAEIPLAKKYEVSRLHVKSALQMLEKEQLAKHVPRCGFVVCGVNESVIDEIILIRDAMEGIVIKRVCEVATEKNIEEIKRIVSRISVFVHNDMMTDAFEELQHFYAYLYDLSGYKRVVTILKNYSDYIDIVKRMTTTKEENLHALEIVESLAAAIEEYDINRAIEMIKQRSSLNAKKSKK